MGHLHARGAETSDRDNAERLIMGGVECIAASAFPEGIASVALGHIHKAQRLGGNEYIRYSGSPLPPSFSDINYTNPVIPLTLVGGKVTSPRGIAVPVNVPFLNVPSLQSSVEDTLLALHHLPKPP